MQWVGCLQPGGYSPMTRGVIGDSGDPHRAFDKQKHRLFLMQPVLFGAGLLLDYSTSMIISAAPS